VNEQSGEVAQLVRATES